MTGKTTAWCLKNALLTGIAALTIPGFAVAQDLKVKDKRTTPVVTSESKDVTVEQKGSVVVKKGTAVTIDSDNKVKNEGIIAGEPADGVTGVLITGSRKFKYTQTGGAIVVREQKKRAVKEVAPNFYNDRFGLRVAAGNYTGDIIFESRGKTPSRIIIDGDQSAGLFLEGNLDGDIDFDASVNLRGANSVGINIAGDLSGDLLIGSKGGVSVQGERTDAIRVSGDIGGTFKIEGGISVTAYQDLTPDKDVDSGKVDADGKKIFVPDPSNAVQAALVSGHGVSITGNIANGLLVNGAAPAGFKAEKAAKGTGRISVSGGGNAIRIDGGAAGITLGAVTDVLYDKDQTLKKKGDPKTRTGLCPTKADKKVATAEACSEYGKYGFINRGALSTNGLYKGVDATAVYAANATIVGGIRNDGTIDAGTNHAVARGMVFGSGLTTPLFFNSNRVTAVAGGDGGDAIALTIEAGASLPSIINQGRIAGSSVSNKNDAVGIRDRSGSVLSVRNSGLISAVRRNETKDGDKGANPRAIAMDFSANTAGIKILNTVRDGFDPKGKIKRTIYGLVIGDVLTGSGDDTYVSDAGATRGNLYLGAGDDTLDLSKEAQLIGNVDFGTGNNVFKANKGVLLGNLSFGAGSHSISLTAGSIFRGSISTIGALDVAVKSSSLLIKNIAPLTITSLKMENDGDKVSILGVSVAGDGGAMSRINANSISIADGTELRTLFTKAFSSFGGSDSNTIERVILSAATLSINIDKIVLNAEGVSPILFEQSLRISDTNPGEVLLRLRRKTASEVGVDPSRAPAFNPVIDAVAKDNALGAALFNTTTKKDFLGAFNQIVAGPLDAPLAYARVQNSSLTSLISQRVERLGERDDLARTAWIQQQSYFVDRKSSADSNGFDGGGFVLAAGADTPIGSLDVIGIAGHLASSRYDEQLGEDFPFNRLTYGVDVYAAEDLGAIELDGRIGYAKTDSDSARNIIVGSVRRQVVGEWEGTQITANGRARYRHTIGKKIELTPFASFDYISLDEDAYVETGDDAIALHVKSREAKSIRGNLGVSLGKSYQLRPTSAYDTSIPGTLTPRLTAAYSHEFSEDDIEATYNFDGGKPFTLMSTPETGSTILGGDIDYENQYAKVNIGASGSFGDNTNAYTLRVGVGLKW